MLTTKQQKKPQTVEKSKSNIKQEQEDVLFSKLTAVAVSSPMHTECCKEESWCNTVENMLFAQHVSGILFKIRVFYYYYFG